MSDRTAGPSRSPRVAAPPLAAAGQRRPDPLRPWLTRAAAGDQRAMEYLLASVTPVVLALTRTVLGPRRPDVEDVAQEALLAVAAAVERFRGDSSFAHYARRIAVRTAITARRRDAVPARDELEDDLPAAGAMGDDERIASKQRLAALRALLDELPEGQAESLAMRVVLGCSLEEVAEETGVPVNTVRSRIRLAKEHIRARITRDARLARMFEADPEADR
jgi:RNA polymerase sigma-70 factor (ECF subfamily)